MSGVWHALLLVGIGIAAGEVEQPPVWPDPRSVTVRPDPRSVTVWTGVRWFTVIVMPVAFGSWSPVCGDDTPRRAGPLDLIGGALTERGAAV